MGGSSTMRSETMDGYNGGTLHCRMGEGQCNDGGCDADLRALGYYPQVNRRRRRDISTWQELGHSRSNTLNEDLQVTLTKDGPTACEAFYVHGSSTVTLYSSYAR